jgi:DNA modification methylase
MPERNGHGRSTPITSVASSGRGLDRAREQTAIRYQPISELKLDPRNPRIHGHRQVQQIARSIRAFGFNVPVLIDANGKVIAGHGRILACRLLGWTEVPTICLEHLSEAQAKAFALADNKLTENSIWDDRLLAEQLKELSALDLDFSIEATGFEIGEIDLRIEGLTPEVEGEDPADVLPVVQAQPTVTQPGDLWILGQHKVYCGNALDEAAYVALMQGDMAAMVITDPPYNVPIQGNVSGLGAIRHRDFAMAVGELTSAEFADFLTRSCSLLAKNSADGSIHFIFIDWRHIAELLAASRQVYSELKNLCVWTKNHTGMGAFYRSRHELVFVFKHGRAQHRNNVQLGKFGRDRTNVWAYATPRAPTDEGNLLALHPTVKPVKLVADAIMDCSARGEIILDGFLGSGTAVIAAERTGRRCFGLECDPHYVDVVIRRWQAYSAASAVHAASGRHFAELEAETEARDGD